MASSLNEADVAAIRDLVDQSSATIAAGDWDGFVDLFVDDMLLMPPGAPTTVGKSASREFLGTFPTITSFQSQMDDVNGSGDFAAARGHYAMTLTTDDGDVADKGTWMFMARRDNGSWRVVWDIWNSDEAPA